MKTKDIVYVMNVDWNWIKQRPHFIAELLNVHYTVHIMFQYRYNRRGLQERTIATVDVEPIYVIPRGDRYRVLSFLNKKIKVAAIRHKIKKTNSEIVYFTFPDQIQALFKDYSGTVIYDCMDDHPAFVDDKVKREKIISDERKLIERADFVFVSSEHLIEVLTSRYGDKLKEKIHLIRNGYSGEIIDYEKTKSTSHKNIYTFSYFGTIGSWFDFDYILRSLNDFPDIQFELFGPIVGTRIPIHERIHYHGTVEHDKLLDSIKDTDCLIMPFVINEIIESVDPVKLYEYINFNKNILAPYYNEIDRFAPFVYFYNDYDEFKLQIDKIKSNRILKYDNSKRIEFLKKNSWECRAKIINRILNEEV